MSMLLRRAMMMASSLVKYIISSVTGLVTFTTNVAASMPSVLCKFAPVQSGSGDPSPDNVRPISGWTGANVTRTGKNLLPKMVAGTYSNNGGTIVVDENGVATMSGTTTATGNVAIIPLSTPLVVTQEMVDTGLYYHINNSVANSNIAASLESSGGVSATSLAFSPVNRISGAFGASFVGKRIDRIRFWISSGVTLSGTYAPSFEFSSAASDYEPCEETSIAFSFLGKNIFTGKFLQGYWAFANGGWTASNTWIATEKIPCKPSTYYTVSASEKMTRYQGFVWYAANGSYLSSDSLNSNTNIGLTKQSPANSAYLVFNIAGYPNTSSTISPSAVSQFQIEEGQTATAYEAPTIIYGGTLDVTAGVLTVNKGIVDLGSLSWGKYTGTQTAYFRASVPGIKPAASSTSPDGISCSAYKPTGSTYVSYSAYPYSIGVTASQTANYIYVQDLRWNNADDFKTNASGVMFVYPLKNPQTVQLTPAQVQSIIGTNNVWHNANGGITVEYYDNQ